jgi:RND superfamily putative drug exporter
VLERWTGSVLRYRALVLGLWLAVLVAGVLSASRLPGLLSTTFAVPDTESARANDLLARYFGERPEGTFVVVFEAPRTSRTLEAGLERRLSEAARTVPTGRARALRDGDGILYGEIVTRLGLAEAKGETDALREALAAQGGPRAWVTGQPAIQHDADPILREDLRRAEAVAVPVALAILAAALGLSLAALLPLLFAACTITATLAVLYVLAHALDLATYVPALVQLIGLGLAIDYSLLVVHRFREESADHAALESAVARTMATAGRAVVFSAVAVAIGLAVLLFVPVPFIRSMGIGGLLVPLVAIAAVVTLQPALLALGGRRPGRRPPAGATDRGFWVRLARGLLRHPIVGLVAGTAVLVALALPFRSLELTPGSISDLPRGAEAMRGFALLTEGVGPGAVTPIQVVIDTGEPRGSLAEPARAAIDRLADGLFHDPEVLVVASGKRAPYVDASRRHARVVVVARHEYGARETRELVRRLREQHVPQARFPARVTVDAGGVPPQGVDFVDRAYGALPWVALAVLVLTYVVLLRAFRSLLLPLKAVALNLLTVAAVCGLLVIVFQWGVGRRVLGLHETDAIEAWVPLFLFATLFGLSMDYEVFLVSRMREAWDEVPDTTRAVAFGLARTGRVVTAAAAIMVVAFAGFVTGRLVGLQQLGFGLAAGVLLDATIVRMLILPCLMAVLGRWNWWLPASVARIVRVEPSPLRP